MTKQHLCARWRAGQAFTFMLLLGSALLLTLPVWAQVPVVESRGVNVQGQPAGQQPAAPQSAQQSTQQPVQQSAPAQRSTTGGARDAEMSGMGELFHQLQTLQVEVQELRGLVEEQAYQIDRLTRIQREQYLDVDRRLAALASAEPAAGAPSLPAIPRPEGQGPGGAAPAAPAATGGATASSGAGERPRLTETDAYTRAFNLTRERQFEAAIRAFDQLLIDYPNGQYSGNAYYWLGELYLALPEPNLNESMAAFTKVVELYPSHQKIPDALYKLGVVHHRKGDANKARQYLRQVQEQHQGSPAARLAEAYATELR